MDVPALGAPTHCLNVQSTSIFNYYPLAPKLRFQRRASYTLVVVCPLVSIRPAVPGVGPGNLPLCVHCAGTVVPHEKWPAVLTCACTDIAPLIIDVVTPSAPRAAIIIATNIVVFIGLFTEISSR